MDIKILHITDLHIGDKENESDYLREGFYRDYIDTLYSKIDFSPEFLIITGDYINAPDKTDISEKFEHASKVISYFQSKFNIVNTNTFLCAGNHDIILEKEKNEEFAKAREQYLNLRNKHSGNPIANHNDFATLYCLNNQYFLTLDSTFKSKGLTKPGILDVKDIDECIKMLRDNNVSEDRALFILSHFPFIEISGTISAIEEPEWYDKHIWKSAFALRKRIEAIRNPAKNNTVVFFGDIHFPYQNNHNGICYLSSGRFGTDIFKPKVSNPDSLSMLPRQARYYKLDEYNLECSTASWNPKSHKENPHTGEWEINMFPIKFKDLEVTPIIGPKNEPAKFDIFCIETEDKIIQLITNNHLYKFGRFNTAHENKVSLAWILVNKLLNNHSLLCDIVTNMKDYITKNNLVPKDTILFGADCWGNVISSQLSSFTGIVNYCTVSRAEGKFHSADELLCKEIKSELPKYKNVVILTDVVATGNGTDFIFKSIKPFCSEHAKFYLFSILADKTQSHYLIENYLHITSCAKLRIPIIDSDKLPSEDILPSIITFK